MSEIDRWIARSGDGVERPADLDARLNGCDWPETGESMIGLKRLDNLQACLVDIVGRGLAGDVVEPACGGAEPPSSCAPSCTRSVMNAAVWVADSFQGLPPPDPLAYPADAGDLYCTYSQSGGEYHGIERLYRVMQRKLFTTHKVNLIGTRELGCFFAERLDGDRDGILQFDKRGMLQPRPWLSLEPMDWHLFNELVLPQERWCHGLP